MIEPTAKAVKSATILLHYSRVPLLRNQTEFIFSCQSTEVTACLEAVTTTLGALLVQPYA